MKTKIDQFIDLLKAYNMHTNIYSEKAYDKLPFHIDDSKVLAGLISNKPLTVFDFGSGSGLPSAIIAILNPNNTVYAIESKSRKSKFLCQVAESLSLTNYKIVNQNIIEFARESRPKPDIITAKAFGPIEKTLDFAKRFSAGHTTLWVPMSQNQKDAMSLQLERVGSFHQAPDSPHIYFTCEL